MPPSPPGPLAVVAAWQAAVNARDAERAQALCAEDVRIEGPRGAVTGRAALAGWMGRTGFSAETTRWFRGADGETAVVEQRAAWRRPDGTRSHAVVGARFTVRDGAIAAYARHDDLATALAAAGLGERDEVHATDDAVVVPAGAGEVLGDAPDRRVELLADGDALHVTWSRFGPGREGADLHVHREHTDLFHVLDGELTLRLGPRGEPVVLGPGTLARIPPLVVHGFRNAGAADVRYLNLHAPGRGFATFMRGLRDGRRVAYDQHDPPPDGGRSPDDAEVVPATPGARVADEHVVVEVVDVEPGAELGVAALDGLGVLAGELAVGDRRAPAGAWVRLGLGGPGGVRAAGERPARVLRVRSP